MTTATPTPLSLSHSTAPLPPVAVAALRYAELGFRFPKRVVAAVAVYETAAVHAAALASRAVSPDEPPLSDLDWDSLAHAEDLMAGARAVLAEAGRLDLIGGGR